MKIVIGADHGGYALKQKIIEYLQSKGVSVEDKGAYELNVIDDFPDFAKQVARDVSTDPLETRGILLCRNGVGMDITANRFKGIRSVLGFNETQIEKARLDDNVNVLCLPSDYITEDQAKHFIDIFLRVSPKTEEKYLRRIQKIDG